jgi:hypothetical protein
MNRAINVVIAHTVKKATRGARNDERQENETR